jgi:hypothetical protein
MSAGCRSDRGDATETFQFSKQPATAAPDQIMRILLLSSLLTLLTLLGFACGDAGKAPGAAAGSDSPTESYKRLYSAVKSKNTDAIKQEMSKTTQEFAGSVAQRQNSPVEKVLENGFTATTFSESLPEIRDERVDGNNGAVEVWNSKESKWEDLPYVKEDTGWKLAVGELFKGSWKSPGTGRAAKEMEAANAMNGGPKLGAMSNANTASNITVTPKMPKPFPPSNQK